LLLSAAGITGIAGLFLPFTSGVSPFLAAHTETVWPLGVPFFLSIFIVAAATRWIISDLFTKVEKAIAYFIGAAATIVILSGYYTNGGWPSKYSDFRDWIVFAIPLVIILSGSFLMFLNSKNRESRAINPLIALQVVYLANSLMCLVAFWPVSMFIDGWNIGAYFCLAASVVYSVQIFLFMTQKNEISDLSEVSVD
jgi:hypothetical protein